MNTDRLADALRQQEGTGPITNGRHMPYRDTAGKLTIGYGRNLDDDGITEDEADYLLAGDITRQIAEVTAAFPWFAALDDVRQRVVTDMAFNMGLGNSHEGLLSFTQTLGRIAMGDYAGAADAMLQSQWARQVGPRALVLSEMMRTGTDPA